MIKRVPNLHRKHSQNPNPCRRIVETLLQPTKPPPTKCHILIKSLPESYQNIPQPIPNRYQSLQKYIQPITKASLNLTTPESYQNIPQPTPNRYQSLPKYFQPITKASQNLTTPVPNHYQTLTRLLPKLLRNTKTNYKILTEKFPRPYRTLTKFTEALGLDRTLPSLSENITITVKKV